MLFIVASILIGTQSQAFASQSSQTATGGVIIVQPASIQVNPASGPGGSTATLTGSNFLPYQIISLVITDANNNSFTFGQATPDGTGAFTTQVTIPITAYPGSATIYAQQNGKTLASTKFTIPFPIITLSPTSGVDGTQVTVTGSGFAINQPVRIFIGVSITNNLTELGTVSADGTGAFTMTVKIPGNIYVGGYIISARETVNFSVYGAAFFTVLPASTTTTVSSSSNPSASGQLVTFTATVNAVAPATGTPTGTVIFTIDGKDQPAVTLSGGNAILSTASLSLGSHTISAKYSGDSNFITSASSAITQTVKFGTTTTLTSSKNPSLFGHSVTFTATVSGVASGKVTPTGTVTFTIDGKDQPAVSISKQSKATFSTSTLSRGSHTISAKYSGDSNFVSSAAKLTQTVQ